MLEGPLWNRLLSFFIVQVGKVSPEGKAHAESTGPIGKTAGLESRRPESQHNGCPFVIDPSVHSFIQIFFEHLL